MKGFIVGILVILFLAGCGAKTMGPPSPLPPILQHKEEGFRAKESPPPKYEKSIDELTQEKAVRLEELGKQPKITMVLTNRAIADALMDIQADIGINIIPSDDVQGIINCELQDVPLETALDMICFPGGYSWRKIDLPDGKFYYIVGSTQAGNPTALPLIVTEKVRTSRPAQEVYDLLGPIFQPYLSVSRVPVEAERTVTMGMGQEYTPLITPPQAGSYELVVSGPREIVERIKRDIKTIVDTPRKQIAIQVLFTEAQFDKSKQIGIDWSKGLELNVGGAGTFTKNWEFGWTSSVMGQLLSGIQAMVRKGQLELKDFPQIVTTEGTLAVINLQTQQWVRLEQPRTLGGETTYYWRERAEKFSYGTTLMVRPLIADNGDIILKLAVEVDDVASVNKDGLPAINKRAVTNEIRIASGETVIVGGLYRQLMKYDKAGLAVLGQIPVLDIPMSMRTGDNQVKELTVFITARVLEPEWVVKVENVRVETKVETKEVIKEVEVEIPAVDPEEWKEALKRAKEELNK